MKFRFPVGNFRTRRPLHARLMLLTLTGILTLLPTSAVWAQAIPNPSFEANTFTVYPGYASGNGGSIAGWTLSNPGRIGLNPAAGNPFADNGATPDGANVAFLRSTSLGDISTLGTTISGLTVGQPYWVSFRANTRATDANVPTAIWSLNGISQGAVTAWGPVGGTNPYYLNTGTFTATASTAVLFIQHKAISESSLLVDDFRIVTTPKSTTLAAAGITGTGATLNGTVNPGNLATTASFQYGLTLSYGSQSATSALPATNVNQPISKLIGGLSPGTTYHYRLVSINDKGSHIGADQTFTTAVVGPTVTTLVASSVTGTNAMLNGTVNPGGDETLTYFEYGPDASYGSFSTTNSLSATNTTLSVSNLVGSLSPVTTYHYRLVAANSAGTTNGENQIFMTTAAVPTVTTMAAVGVTATTATLNGTVNPGGGVTAAYFEYGPDASYGNFSTTNSLPATNTTLSVSNLIGSLSPSTTYHYRLVAGNSAGSGVGTDQTFTTEFPNVTLLSNSGTTTGSGSYAPGANVVISAQGANAHWTFITWNDGETNRVRTITMPPTNITYTATFVENVASLTTYVAIAGTNPVWPYDTWATAATNIQDAVDILLDGDTVIVSNGVYATGAQNGNRVMVDKAITVQSVNGPEFTLIEGAGPIGPTAVRCVYLGANAVLSGFTLTNGATQVNGYGGGVLCGFDAVVTNCTLTGNSTSSKGGGSFRGTLYNCTFTGNSADDGGGSWGGILNNCTLTGNSANYGGGAYVALLSNCTLTGNSASYGGGAYLSDLDNCTLTGNSAGYSGGGSYVGTLNNCTLTGNVADDSGGGSYGGTLNNCIVYFNTASNYSYTDNHYNSTFNSSCTTPLPPGPGNIDGDPLFMATNDVHLALGSPCINAGDNAYAANSPTDLAGSPRIGQEVVDMGAYESAYPRVTVAAIGGTTTGSGSYAPDTNIVISASSDNAHWTFSSWNDGDTNQTRVITVPHTDITYTAIFEENVAPLTAYVAVSNSTPIWPYDTWATAATNIQDAVDILLDGDTVIVSNGVYATGTQNGNRVMVDKAITVQSVNGPEFTLIEGAGPVGPTAVRCVYLGTNAVLSGFTLTNGATQVSGYGGGIWCGPGAVVTNCTLTGNAAGYGGGAYEGTLYNCTLSGNVADTSGGGALGGILNNCTLMDNAANGVFPFTGGGGAYGATLNNCTLTGNSASFFAGGSYGGTLNNCIVYFNTAPNNPDTDNYTGGTINSSCTTPLPAGSGNIADDPLFVAPNDFHLAAGSPCINAGSNAFIVGSIDLDGNPRMINGTVDMGAYEDRPDEIVFVTVTVTGGTLGGRGSGWYGTGSTIGISAAANNAHWIFSGWNDGDMNLTRTITVPSTNITYTAAFIENVGSINAYVASASTNPVWPYSTWATAATNIQDAVDILLDGDMVIVSNGVYATGGQSENRVMVDKAITVQSVNGPEVTLIEGAGPIGPTAVRCVYLGTNAVLSGFTLTSGATQGSGSGGGVWCGPGAVVTNCTLTGNSASSSGGGSYGGTLHQCTLSGNSAFSGGGAAEGTLYNCALIGNSADFDFGSGGGSYGGTLYHCMLTGNSGDYGGGSYGGTLNNCTLIGNTGGVYYGNGGGSSGSTLNNCTLTGNTVVSPAGSGGGAVYSTLNNCIVYFNTAPNNPATDNHFSCTINYSCTTPLPVGPGNIDGDPLFVATNDFHLAAGSPGINAGSNTFVVGTTDLDGNARVMFGTVDMGAYESQVEVVIATDPPVLTGLTNLGNGAFQFGFTNAPGASFTVYASTNLALPLNTWSNLGPVVESPAGQFQFTDPQATNIPLRFYRVISP